MKTFKEYVDQKEKPWVAKKEDVISAWNKTRADMPLNPRPVSSNHIGTRFDQDGVRITGSPDFINSVLGRLKSFLFYVNHPTLNLDVKYRQVPRRKSSSQPSFACYINIIQK